MKPVHIVLVLCLLALAALLVRFGAAGSRSSRPIDGRWTRALADRRSDPFPRTFVSAADGEPVVIGSPPRRIVSGTIFADAVLLEICAVDRIAALHDVSTDAHYSPVAAASSGFPRHHGGDPEEILALEPDLVIVSSFSRRETQQILARQGCAVLRFAGFSSVADIQNHVRALGYVLGLDEPAERLVTAMQERLDRVAARAGDRHSWRLLHYESGRTSGLDTTFDSLLKSVGARNVGAELGLEGSMPVSIEQVLTLDPDALVVGVPPGGEAAVREQLRRTPGFAALRAVRDEHLLLVPASLLLSTSHHAAAAAEHIAATLDRWGRP